LETFRHPNTVTDTGFFQDDVRATLHTGHEQSHRHRQRLGYLPVDINPPEVLLVDPKSPFHLEENLVELAVRVIARIRRGVKYLGRPVVDYFLVEELEVEGLWQVA